jgi:hypothetical protein
MTDLDLRLRDELDVLFPAPRSAARWEDVVDRAHPPLRRRPLVLALAATLFVLGSAAAVTAALGGFDAWLSGSPGKPAAREEQARFQAANGRTWAAFPKSTRLRELIRTTVEGKTYALFGFRSGSTLCLKLKAVSLGHSSAPACIPVSTVAHATAPIVVVQADYVFQDRHAHSSAEASFGIAADGVSRVEVRDTTGTHRGTLGGNAYLFVENEPNTGNRVVAISARRADGRRTTIDLAPTFGDGGPLASISRPARGPSRVQVTLRHPRIAWALNGATRHVKPDPLSDIGVGLEAAYCLVLTEGRDAGRSCSDADDFFSRGPINTVGFNRSGEASNVVAGAAADGIVRLVAFPADGQRATVPLRDNLFAIRLASSQFPVRLVGYDRRGRIVGIQTLHSFMRMALPNRALHGLEVVRRVTGPNGAAAVLRIGPVVRGVHCWRVNFTTGPSRTGCTQTIPTGPWAEPYLVQQAGRDLFLVGRTRPPVESVRLQFADGTSVTTQPARGLFLFAIPRAQVSAERRLAFVLGLRHDGSVQQRRGVLFKLRS